MPIYTCTTASPRSPLTVKADSGRRDHPHPLEINHVPSTYVNVVFHELPADNVYTDGVPAQSAAHHRLGPRRAPRGRNHQPGHRDRRRSHADHRHPADRVLVVFQSSPAHYAVEGGRVLPEPGEEQAWLAAK